jgi:hypothetical protein
MDQVGGKQSRDEFAAVRQAVADANGVAVRSTAVV